MTAWECPHEGRTAYCMAPMYPLWDRDAWLCTRGHVTDGLEVFRAVANGRLFEVLWRGRQLDLIIDSLTLQPWQQELVGRIMDSGGMGVSVRLTYARERGSVRLAVSARDAPRVRRVHRSDGSVGRRAARALVALVKRWE